MLLGTGLTLTTSTTLLQSCLQDTKETWEPKFLSKEIARLVGEVVYLLIPDPDIPNSIKNVVPKYIDTVLLDYTGKEEQDKFIKEVNAFDSRCKKIMGKDFIACNDDQKITFLKKEEKHFVESREPTFYGTLKQMIFESFFRTEYGITQLLHFEALPGSYSGCIPMSDIGRIQHSNDVFKL